MKNIVITGASRGIGFDTALEMCNHPDHHVLALSRNEEGLIDLQRRVQEKRPAGRLSYLVFDLSDGSGEIPEAALSGMKKIDVLINNAGLLINKPFENLTGDDWQRIFSVNLFGAVSLIRRLLPYLEKSTSAHIVNISSMGGFQGSSKFPGLSAYSASKAALANLTECLAEEFKDRKIAVNCLALGAVQTEMLQEAFPGYKAPVTSAEMGSFLARFALEGHKVFNGKILPVSVSTP